MKRRASLLQHFQQQDAQGTGLVTLAEWAEVRGGDVDVYMYKYMYE